MREEDLDKEMQKVYEYARELVTMSRDGLVLTLKWKMKAIPC